MTDSHAKEAATERECPDCGASIEKDAKFCRQCGLSLAGQSAPSDTSAPGRPAMRACNFCAEEIRFQAQICKHCGREQTRVKKDRSDHIDELYYAIDAGDFSRAVSVLPPQEQAAYHAEVERLRKHIGVAYLYWFVLIGIFGAQKFYLREFKWGTVYLCCTLLTCALVATGLSLVTFDVLVTKATSFTSVPFAILCAAALLGAVVVGTALWLDLFCIPSQVAKYNDRVRRQILIGIAQRLRPNSFARNLQPPPALFTVVSGLVITAVAVVPLVVWVVTSSHHSTNANIAGEGSDTASLGNSLSSSYAPDHRSSYQNVPATDWDGSESLDKNGGTAGASQEPPAPTVTAYPMAEPRPMVAPTPVARPAAVPMPTLARPAGGVGLPSAAPSPIAMAHGSGGTSGFAPMPKVGATAGSSDAGGPTPVPVAAAGGGRGGGGGGAAGAPSPVRASHAGGASGGPNIIVTPSVTGDTDDASTAPNTSNSGSPRRGAAGSLENDPYMRDVYMKGVQRQIKKHWSPRRSNESKTVVVLFKIHSQGDISDLRIETSSGSASADNAALKAVEDAAPFKPLPAGAEENVDIRFSFDYNLFGPRRAF